MHRDADHLATSFKEVVDVVEAAWTKHYCVVLTKRKLVGSERRIDRLNRGKVEIARGGDFASSHRDMTSLVSEELDLTGRGRYAGIRKNGVIHSVVPDGLSMSTMHQNERKEIR